MISLRFPRATRALDIVLLAAAATLVASACSASDARHPDTAVVSTTSVPAPSPTVVDTVIPHFSLTEFGHLRWIVGDWRGMTPEGKPFYESYRMVNDSTMHFGGFSDSTFRTQTDSAVIGLRGGIVLDQGTGVPWAATRLDSHFVNFASVKAPTSHFAWMKQSTDKWEAQLFTEDGHGHEQRVVNAVERVKRK